jgi:tight adherence protein C
MMPVIIGLGVLLLVVLVLIGIRAIRSRQSGPSIEDRMAEFGAMEAPPTLEEIELSQPFTERILLPMVDNLSEFATRFTPQKSMESIQHKLDLAGNPYDWSPTRFLGLRVLAAILMGGLGIFVVITASFPFIQRVGLAAGMVGLGYYLPVLWLSGQISSRQDEIIKALPDALDLLTICVEAGLGFDAAMSKVAAKWDNELSTEFSRVIQELQLGKLRREALRDMADRIEIKDVSTFIAAIIQADQLGVSIAKVLRIQSEQMRMRRRQRAEEAARKAPIKMLPAIAFLIFPAIFIILLGPAVVKVKNMFMGGGMGGLGGGGGGGGLPLP